MVHNRSFEACWGRPNCSSDSVTGHWSIPSGSLQVPVADRAQQGHVSGNIGFIHYIGRSPPCRCYSNWRWLGFGAWGWGSPVSLMILLQHAHSYCSGSGWAAVVHPRAITHSPTLGKGLVWVLPKAASELSIWGNDPRKSRQGSRKVRQAGEKPHEHAFVRYHGCTSIDYRSHLRIISWGLKKLNGYPPTPTSHF